MGSGAFGPVAGAIRISAASGMGRTIVSAAGERTLRAGACTGVSIGMTVARMTESPDEGRGSDLLNRALSAATPRIARGCARARFLDTVIIAIAAKQQRPEAFAAIGVDRIKIKCVAAARLNLGQRELVILQRNAIGRQMHGFSVGKNPAELIAGHARPGAHRADIQMHEGRAGRGVIADAAMLEAHRDLAHLRHGNAGDVKIHRVAARVLAILGHRATAAAQHLVGAGGSDRPT